jgi:predicted dehydrogenase
MKLSRRKFIYTNTLLFGGMILADRIPANASIPAMPKKGKPGDFILAFCGDPQQFKFYQSILEGTFQGKFVHIKARRIRSVNPNAVWLGKNLKHKDEYAVKCLSKGIHILVEPPLASDLELFDILQLQANLKNTRIGIAHFHHYSPSVGKAAGMVRSGAIGQLKNVQVQLNDASLDPLMQGYTNSYVANGFYLISLVCEILGSVPVTLSASPNISADVNIAAERIALMMTLDGVPVSYTNIRNQFDKTPGWSVTFYGESGQFRLCPNNQLDILDNNAWKVSVPQRNSGKPVEVKLLVEDFIQSCITGKEPEPNSAEAFMEIILNGQAVVSARTEKVMHLFNENDEKR